MKYFRPLQALLLFGLFLVNNLHAIENAWITAELLYWKAYEKSFVLTNKTSPIFTTDDFTKTKVLHPNFDWDPGSRISLGFLSPDYCIDTSISWTHYHSSLNQKQLTDSNNLTNIDNQLGMFPIWSLSDDIMAGDYVSDAFLKGKLSLDLFDVEVGRAFMCLEFLQIRPYVGLRGAWIRQKADVRYVGGIFLIGIIEGGIPQNGTDYIHLKNDFWGVGPRIGLSPVYCLGNGFSLYADAAISELFGTFDISQTETYLDSSRSSIHQHPTRFRCIGDLAAGIAWTTSLCQNAYSLSLKLGWEYHIFFNQLQLKQNQFHLVPSNRDLQVQGITIGANLEF